MKLCAKTFLGGIFVCAPSFFVCAHLTACVRMRAQLRGNIGSF